MTMTNNDGGGGDDGGDGGDGGDGDDGGDGGDGDSDSGERVGAVFLTGHALASTRTTPTPPHPTPRHATPPGKSTLFNALTGGESAQAANFPFCTVREIIMSQKKSHS